MEWKEGDVVEGWLLSIETIEVIDPADRDKPEAQQRKNRTPRYTVEELYTGELLCFLGAYQLNTKLRTSDKGHKVLIRYEGEDQNVKRGNNAMKVFKVFVSPHTKDTITNDDIGF